MYQLLPENQSAFCRRGQVPFPGISLPALSLTLSPTLVGPSVLRSPHLRIRAPHSPLTSLRFINAAPAKGSESDSLWLLIVGTWQVFEGAGWAGPLPLTDRERWLVGGERAAPWSENEGSSVADPALAQPCQLRWQCGQSALPILRTVSPLSLCLPVSGYGVAGVGPESVLGPECQFRGINPTSARCTWTKHPVWSRVLSGLWLNRETPSYWCSAFPTRHFFPLHLCQHCFLPFFFFFFFDTLLFLSRCFFTSLHK